MPLEDSFLGRGWSFPPSFRAPADGPAAEAGIVMVTGLTDIEQSLTILLTTRLAERIMAPDYGCDLHAFLFEPLDATRATQLQDLVETAILYHEPRITPLRVTATQPPAPPGVLLIAVEYQVRTTNARHNFVFPFYRQEASELNISL